MAYIEILFDTGCFESVQGELKLVETKDGFEIFIDGMEIKGTLKISHDELSNLLNGFMSHGKMT